MRILQSIIIIAIVVGALVYGWLTVVDSKPECYQLKAHERCKTLWEIVSGAGER